MPKNWGNKEQSPEINRISGAVVSPAIEVHSELGPGLLESAYEACLAYELNKRGFKVERQVPFTFEYDGNSMDVGYRVDLLVEDQVVVEVKAVEKLLNIHSPITQTLPRKTELPKLPFNIRPIVKNGTLKRKSSHQ